MIRCSRTIPSLGNVTLEKIVWWGYRDPVNDPYPAGGEFRFPLNGSVVAGAGTARWWAALPNTNRLLLKYTLDVTDAPLTARPRSGD